MFDGFLGRFLVGFCSMFDGFFKGFGMEEGFWMVF